MKVMAARIAAEGESLATSAFLWQDIYNSTTDPTIKKNAELHLQLLRVREDCKQLDALADDTRAVGKRPTHMNELVWAGLLPGSLPILWGSLTIFSDEGKAELNLDSRSANNSCCSSVSAGSSAVVSSHGSAFDAKSELKNAGRRPKQRRSYRHSK